MQEEINLNDLIVELYDAKYHKVGSAHSATEYIDIILKGVDNDDNLYQFNLKNKYHYTMQMLSDNYDYFIKVNLKDYHLLDADTIPDERKQMYLNVFKEISQTSNQFAKSTLINDNQELNEESSFDSITSNVDTDGMLIFKGHFNSEHPQIDFQYMLLFMKNVSNNLYSLVRAFEG